MCQGVHPLRDRAPRSGIQYIQFTCSRRKGVQGKEGRKCWMEVWAQTLLFQQNPPKIRECQKQTTFPQTFSKSLCELFSAVPVTSIRKPAENSAVKQRGRERKGAPRNHPEVSSQKVADFECRFPYDSYGKNRAPFGLFWEKGFGAISGGPSSPGPFGLLLKIVQKNLFFRWIFLL